NWDLKLLSFLKDYGYKFREEYSLYYDSADITVKAYKTCIQEGYCKTRKSLIFKGNLILTKEMAESFCAYQGKRLAHKDELLIVKELKGRRENHFCVSDTPFLFDGQAWMLRTNLKYSHQLKPIDKELYTLLHAEESIDILDKPLCKQKYKSPANCKDPVTYVKKNERRNWLFASYIKNLGGAYVGVASDANYSYIAHAKSEYAWLFDFDINIVLLHKILKIFILKNEKPEGFISMFRPEREKASLWILKQAYKADKNLNRILAIYKKYRQVLYPYYLAANRKDALFKDFGWLRTDESYQYIRQMYQNGRMVILSGDMLKEKTMRSIGNTARKMSINVRVYYPSNVEVFWSFNEAYKKNVLGLPFDDKSVIISTLSNTWNRRGVLDGYWHYLVRGGLDFQRRLLRKDFKHINQLRNYRVLSKQHGDISTVGVPSRIE
ncbi:MAG: hypothetical protein KDK45_24745, partial [Leptospiraceae bacterium]|nr:hypothetical protein [Leptospiraceae bacterium]